MKTKIQFDDFLNYLKTKHDLIINESISDEFKEDFQYYILDVNDRLLGISPCVYIAENYAHMPGFYAYVEIKNMEIHVSSRKK